jgi:putative Holliday junction resolvase
MGRRMAIDVGKVRIGLASCDREAILASPLKSVNRSSETSKTIAELVELVNLNDPIEIYVGEPLALSGKQTESTTDAKLIAFELATCVSIPVRMIDERFTTVTAANKLRAAGMSSRESKLIIDSASAVEVLESAISYEKNTGLAPGHLVGDSVGA